MEIEQFVKKAAEGFRIVCTGDLLVEQISEARVEDRMFVTSDGLGFVLLPWELSTKKDKERERKLIPKETPMRELTLDEVADDVIVSRTMILELRSKVEWLEAQMKSVQRRAGP